MIVSHLSTYLQQLESTASRNSMTEILAKLFTEATPEEIGAICYLLQGRVAPLYEAIEFGLADKFAIRAIAASSGETAENVVAAFKKNGDLGKAAELLHKGSGGRVTVLEFFAMLKEIAMAGGEGSQERKISLLATLLSRVDGLSSRYAVRIPLDKLRLGFSDMTILDALSWMLAGNKSLRPRLEDAYNVRPDIGLLAETVRAKGVAGLHAVHARVGSPVLAALCQRLPTADDMIKKMGVVAVEPKYDGVRVQIHFKRNGFSKDAHETVRSFSRNLEQTTAMFPELLRLGSELHADDVILDAEAIGFDPKTGKFFPFQETMTRKRKHNIEESSSAVPIVFFVFDILYKDGKDLLAMPLKDRRTILEKTVRPKHVTSVSPQIITDNADTLRQYHDEQLKKGLEGAVVKKWDSPYEPGRKGFSWVKFKEEEGKDGKLTDTIDAVVMGYYVGEGKRTGFGIGAFLVGVPDKDRIVTLTKIGTGVSDALWKELFSELNTMRVSEKPKRYADVNKVFIPDVWIDPKLVVEIAGDDLTKSSTHGAGFAVRFPRLVRIRRDKGPAQATTVAEITAMFRGQTASHSKE
jgi:DNA ligase-1